MTDKESTQKESTNHEKLQAYWQGFPEAPCSDTIKWTDGAGFSHMTTIRQWSGSALYDAVSKMIALITETGGKPDGAYRPAPVTAPPPAVPAVVQDALKDGEKQVAANLQAALDDVPPAPSGKQWLLMDINRLVIKPEPGDKYTLELYQAGHKWADLKAAKRDLATVSGYIKHVTSADASKPQDLTVNCVAYYLHGKEKTDKPGEFWMDLYHLRNK